jgi:outer membrane protein
VRMYRRMVGCVAGALMVVGLVGGGAAVQAADTKIGVIDMKKVLSTSVSGKKAQDIIEAKMKELQAGFKKDEEALVALQKDMEKKSSAWSDEVKQEKAVEFQKKRRDLGVKQEDANLELKKLREQHVNPILKKLEDIVQKVAQDQGYAIILPRNTVLYATDKMDISDTVTSELNKVMK